MDKKDVKSMNGSNLEAEGQALRDEDIPSSDLRVIPATQLITIGELLGPGEHMSRCPLFDESTSSESAESGTKTSPDLCCICADLQNIVVYPPNILLGTGPPTRDQNRYTIANSRAEAREVVDFQGVDMATHLTSRATECRCQQHEMRHLLKADSDEDNQPKLMDSTEVEATK